MTSTLASNTWVRYIGEARFVTVDLSDDLATGQTVSSATWTPESAATTYTASSAAVSSSGKEISAKFTAVAAGFIRVDISATCINPSETIITAIYFKQMSAS